MSLFVTHGNKAKPTSRTNN